MQIQRVLAAIAFVILYLATDAAANPTPTDATMLFPSWSFLTQRETWAAIAVLAFGVLMAIFTIVLLRSDKIDGEEALRIVALLTIVSGTLFLVAAGYNAEQISPALGILGTVAGYLLGRSEKSPQGKEKE